MSAEPSIAREVATRQETMFAMFVGPGLHTSRAALAVASGIPESTLRDWAHGAAMPLHGALVLSKFLPPAAINMLTEPAGKRLVDAEEAEANWDGFAAKTAGLTAEICEARSDGVITHVERERLRKRTREVIAEAQSLVGTG
ncbi:MAG TPA: hypothetical protein VFJ46_17645 [Xanthobacteraceae bacterium]|nr:hypothetical protein [Xanthobacteraceae bacterium]